ncbi:MAG: hypothetical protein CFE44_02600 [Burkholderiales bacterium PBB4]|nr:MAG: hypothetical protein CFE44_02600 [Burkholderiales bacterium PBB4]
MAFYFLISVNLDKKSLLAVSLVLVAATIVTVKIATKAPNGSSAELPGGLGPQNRQRSANERPLIPASGLHSNGNAAPNEGLTDADAEKLRTEAIEKMQEASTSYDPAELPVIRPYLVHPDPKLRAAAVDAILVLGDASAGPMLREAARTLSSAEEAKKMEQAADYIELPPANLKEITEMMKKRREANEATKTKEP